MLSLTLNEECGDLVSTSAADACREGLSGASYVGEVRKTESVLAILEFRSMSTRPSSVKKSVPVRW
jgi:hypothetical protein